LVVLEDRKVIDVAVITFLTIQTPSQVEIVISACGRILPVRVALYPGAVDAVNLGENL